LRILVIGSAGFIGQALTRHLTAAGHEVEGWSRSRQSQQPGLTQRAIDLLDPRTFEAEHGPWAGAIHLAAHSVPSRDFTGGAILDNLRMTAHAVDHLARVQPGLRLIFVSSAYVYRAAPGLRREDEELRPENAYGLSKQLCEAWVRARERDLNVVIVRAFNQIGPGMRAGLLIPDLLQGLSRGSGPLVMRGSDATRDFLDVRDGAAALARLVEADTPSGSVFNLCSGEAQTVSALARALMRRLGIERELRFQPAAQAPLVGDPARLMRALGWKPSYALADTLDDIVAGVAR
jgi:nucleoside-diphosphate-sugar epimerase